MPKLQPPFPYFGSKRAVADIVWKALGNPRRYIEPFCGSAAVLLCRTDEPRYETVNDADCHISNFWRALKHDPEAVADFADWPVNHADQTARHNWLVNSEQGQNVERIKTDPDFYDVKVAGWWVWGLSCWIGTGWCKKLGKVWQQVPEINLRKGVHSHRINQKVPEVGRPKGIFAQRVSQQAPNLTFFGGVQTQRVKRSERINQKIPVLNYQTGIHSQRLRSGIYDEFQVLSDRLRNVMVVCGDWTQVVSTPSIIKDDAAIFFDPPYSHAHRNTKVYNRESATVYEDVQKWCIEHEALCKMVLAGYDEHDGLETRGWRKINWKANGGFANQGKNGGDNNRHAEVLWISPLCDKTDLF